MSTTHKTYGALVTGRTLEKASEPDPFDFLLDSKVKRKTAVKRKTHVAPLNGETITIDANK